MPLHRPVAAARVFKHSRRDLADRIDGPGATRRHQQRAAERRACEKLRTGDEHQIAAIQILLQARAAEAHLAGVDDDLDPTRPTRRDFVEALIAWSPPAQLR